LLLGINLNKVKQKYKKNEKLIIIKDIEEYKRRVIFFESFSAAFHTI